MIALFVILSMLATAHDHPVFAGPRAPSLNTLATTDSVTPAVRRGCRILAATARRLGAARIVASDASALDGWGRRSLPACQLRVDQFSAPVLADSFRNPLPDSTWTTHPFEGTGGRDTYAIVADGVQCEVQVALPSGIRRISATTRTTEFHIRCYPD